MGEPLTDEDASVGGCSYQGHEFGAHYPDSVCIEGYLWDADSCDEPGGGLRSGGDLACPNCNTEAYLTDALEDAKSGDCGLSGARPWVAAMVWEAAVRHAEGLNPGATKAFMATLEPFTTVDWPDREAALNRAAPWDRTIDVVWIAAEARHGTSEPIPRNGIPTTSSNQEAETNG